MEPNVLEASEELLTIAQIAVGMAGFAGVAAAILLERSFQRDDQLRFLALFSSTIAVVVLSFLPLLLIRGGLQGAVAWRWASVGFLATSIAALPLSLMIAREAKTFQKVPPKGAFFAVWSLFALAPLLQLTNLFGLLGGPGPVPYLLGLLSWLGAGAVLFVIIVLIRSPGTATRREDTS